MNNNSALVLGGAVLTAKVGILGTTAGTIATTTGGVGVATATVAGTTVTAVAVAPFVAVAAIPAAIFGLAWLACRKR